MPARRFHLAARYLQSICPGHGSLLEVLQLTLEGGLLTLQSPQGLGPVLLLIFELTDSIAMLDQPRSCFVF